jgi:hypothetical protein
VSEKESVRRWEAGEARKESKKAEKEGKKGKITKK